MKYLLDSGTYRLTFKFYDDGRNLVDVSSPTVSIYNPTNALAINVQSLTKQSTGVYYYDLNTSLLGTTYGTYTAIAQGTYNGTSLFADSPEVFSYSPQTDYHLYVTVSEFRADNNIPDSQDNRLILDILHAATNFVNAYCRRKFHLYTITNEPHTLNVDTYVFLNHFPIDSITSFTIKDVSVSSSEYTLDSSTGKIKFKSAKTGDMKITYVAGVRTVPSDVHLACKKIANYLWNRRLSEGLSSERLFSYSYTLMSDVFNEVKALLDKHKHVRL